MTTMLPHDSSPDEHDSEQPPSKTSKGNEQAPAAKQKGPNRTGEWKEYNWWSRPDHSDSDPEITSFIRADLAELNKSDGITSLPPRHYDRKRGNIYGDWMYRNSWSTHKAPSSTPRSCVAVFVKPKLWRCLASSFPHSCGTYGSRSRN